MAEGRSQTPDTREARLRRRAESIASCLVFCTGLNCIQVLWWCTIGFCSLFSGLCGALALECIYGRAPSHASHVRATIAAGLSAVGAACAATCFWMAGFAPGPYFGSGIDPMLYLNLYGYLDGAHATIPEWAAPGIPFSVDLVAVVQPRVMGAKPWAIVTHIAFPIYFVVAMGLSLALSVTCAQLAVVATPPADEPTISKTDGSTPPNPADATIERA